MKKKTFWLSFDLGLRGDYRGLYAWLDTVAAQECGVNFAVFHKAADSPHEIEQEIKERVKLEPTDRLYLIYRDEKTGLTKGTFMAGGRKRAVWEGYGVTAAEPVEDY